MGMVSWIGAGALLFVFGVVTSQIFLVGYLASKIIPGEKSDFVQELPPIRIPKLSNIFIKTYTRIGWFLNEAVPLFLLGTFILFVFAKIGLLSFLENIGKPITTGALGLPVETTKAFILGFLRRDYGAAGLFKLAKEGLMNPAQMVVSLIVITLFVPCIANLFVIIKERGLKVSLYMVSFIIPYAIGVGAVINWLFKLFHITL